MNAIKNAIFSLMPLLLVVIISCQADAQSKNLRLVFIRHAEKPDDGDNLNCKGINRSMQLPAVLYKKFGKPDRVYVPIIKLGKVTKRARMLETILPFVAKYDLKVNTEYEENDYKQIAEALSNESGTVIIVWEHKFIEPIVEYLGIKNAPHWKESDYDGVWIITLKKGKPVLSIDKEGINPTNNCDF